MRATILVVALATATFASLALPVGADPDPLGCKVDGDALVGCKIHLKDGADIVCTASADEQNLTALDCERVGSDLVLGMDCAVYAIDVWFGVGCGGDGTFGNLLDLCTSGDLNPSAEDNRYSCPDPDGDGVPPAPEWFPSIYDYISGCGGQGTLLDHESACNVHPNLLLYLCIFRQEGTTFIFVACGGEEMLGVQPFDVCASADLTTTGDRSLCHDPDGDGETQVEACIGLGCPLP